MELHNYPTITQEEYEILAQNFNTLADALTPEQPNPELYHPETINQLSQQVLQFLKQFV